MSATSSQSSAPVVLGRTEPRLWTPPLRELTPETSHGFEVIEFADDVLNHPLDEWEAWLAIHGLELLPNGLPRFRKVLALVARQNGKTELLVVLSLWWQFVCSIPLTLSTSTKLEYAKEAWQKAVDLAEASPQLDAYRASKWTKTAAGKEESFTLDKARYKIAAANDRAGRSLTVYRLILDELRMHQTYKCWGAAYYAMNAVPDAQAWCISNAGDDTSVVLNDLRDSAIKESDPQLGLFEWSAELTDDPLDIHALAKANPNLGRRLDATNLLADAKRAVEKGGETLATFKTESMCIRVPKMDPAVDADAWKRCHEDGDLNDLKSRIALFIDVAPDQMHATMVAAAVQNDGRVRIEPVGAWDGYGCVDRLRLKLPNYVDRIKPQKLGYMPSGPAAVLVADLTAERMTDKPWPPPGVTVEPVRGDSAAVCMGFAEQVTAEKVVHSDDPLLNAHVTGAEKLWRMDSWVFSRKGDGHCDAAYAAAGAVHLARTLPAPLGKPRVITLAS